MCIWLTMTSLEEEIGNQKLSFKREREHGLTQGEEEEGSRQTTAAEVVLHLRNH